MADFHGVGIHRVEKPADNYVSIGEWPADNYVSIGEWTDAILVGQDWIVLEYDAENGIAKMPARPATEEEKLAIAERLFLRACQ